MKNSPPWRMIDVLRPLLERLDELHNKYGLSKTWEAEDMCNYSQFLVQKGKAEGREEQKIKDKLEMLERMEEDHYSDMQIIRLLRIDAEHLKFLREMLQEKRATVMAV